MGEGNSYFGKNLTDAVHDGKVTEDRVTDMAVRIVASYYKVCLPLISPQIVLFFPYSLT